MTTAALPMIRRAIHHLHRRLAVRMLIAPLAVLLVMSLVSSWIEQRHTTQLMTAQIDHAGRALAQLAASASLEPLLVHDAPVLQTIVDDIVVRNQQVESASVIRADGRAMATAPQRENRGASPPRRLYRASISVDGDELGFVVIALGTSDADAAIADAARQSRLRAVVTFAITGLWLLLILSRAISEPIRRLGADADRLGGGDLSAPVALNGAPTELEGLASTLDTMRVRLQRSRDELETSNTVLECTLEEREAALAAARAASNARRDLLANMSHEIRTPMTAIIGFTDLLAEDDVAEHTRRELIERVRSNGMHLLGIINDILDMTRIESGGFTVAPQPIEIRDVVRTALDDVAPRITAGVALTTTIDPDVPAIVTADPVRLRQVIFNLVGNAAKFTDTGSITVNVTRCRDDGDRLVLDVIDTGPGISPEDAAGLFEPFVQADGTASRNHSGTGLGLPIARGITRAMGGDLVLLDSSTAGSTFRATIGAPAAASLPPKATDDAAACAATLPPETERPAAALRILLVEDGLDNQRLLMHLLRRLGADASLAENGRDGMTCALDAAAAGTPFDVILMDMQMPVMSGYDAVTELRAASYDGLIFALTAHAMPEERARCLDIGCDDFLTKPITRATLHAALHTATETLRARREV